MKTARLAAVIVAAGLAAAFPDAAPAQWELDPSQTPGWTQEEIETLLYGSMSDEVFPEPVLRAFVAANPDLFPGGDFSAYGVVGKGLDRLPVGFSRRKVDHLGGLMSWGINCMSCHSGLVARPGKEPLLLLGATSTFDSGGFYGAALLSSFRAGSKGGIGPFLKAYLAACDPKADPKVLEERLAAQREAIEKVFSEDPFGAAGIAAGELHAIQEGELTLDAARLSQGEDMTAIVRSLQHLFHNIRVALHVPEPPPKPTNTPFGPGRNDAFGLLAGALLGAVPACTAPVKFGIPWNLADRRWVHWDGNTSDPDSRNVLAALGLGCPTVGNGKLLDFRLVRRQTELSERLRSPRYPFPIDAEAAKGGQTHYEAHCARCHGAKDEERLYALEEIGTDPNRARIVDAAAIDGLRGYLGALKVEGFVYDPASMRATQKYWASDLAGVWARAPYLHNGSVRTMGELLRKPADRAKTWKRGTHAYDEEGMGYRDEGGFELDTTLSGNSNGGHVYGTDLSELEKRELVEYLKTR